jgi:hypothetical protein
MSQSVAKHQEDDGNLSFFASGDIVVISCEHGHYWVLEAEKQSSETVKGAFDRVLSVDQAESLYRAL